MAISKYLGTLTIPGSTGSQAVTGVGFQPVCVIFFGAVDNDGGTAVFTNRFGVAIGSATGDQWAASSYAVDAGANANTSSSFDTGKCIVAAGWDGGETLAAGFTSMDSDGFTINWSAVPGSTQYVHFLALAGLSVDVGSFSLNTSTGNQSVTGVGFQPKAIIFGAGRRGTTQGSATEANFCFGIGVSSTKRWQTSHNSEHGVTTSNNCRLFNTNKAGAVVKPTDSIEANFDFVSQDSDGFTINITTAPAAAEQFGYIALGGSIQASAATFTQKTSAGSQSTTGVGFQPELLLFGSHGNSTADSVVVSSVHAFGAAISSTSRRNIAAIDSDGLATTQTYCNANTDECIAQYNTSGGIIFEADFTSMDSDGFTLNYSTADASARHIGYLALAATAAGVTASITGTSATASAGTLSCTGGALALLGNNASTSSAGTIGAIGAANVLLDGISGIAQAGTVASAGGAQASISGTAATSQAGTITVSGGALVQIVGTSSTGQAGTLSVVTAGAVTVGLTGVSASGLAGTISVTAGAYCSITGVSSNASAGSISAVIGQTVALSGVSASSIVGVLDITTGATVAITGITATGQVGTISATTDIVEVSIPGYRVHKVMHEDRVYIVLSENRVH